MLVSVTGLEVTVGPGHLASSRLRSLLSLRPQNQARFCVLSPVLGLRESLPSYCHSRFPRSDPMLPNEKQDPQTPVWYRRSLRLSRPSGANHEHGCNLKELKVEALAQVPQHPNIASQEFPVNFESGFGMATPAHSLDAEASPGDQAPSESLILRYVKHGVANGRLLFRVNQQRRIAGHLAQSSAIGGNDAGL